MNAPPVLPPLGSPDESAIVAFLTATWDAWRQVRTPWLLQVEQNARALSGRPFDRYDGDLGQFVDLEQVFLDPVGSGQPSRAPVFNWLRQTWFSHSLAKLTENIVKLGATPASADHAAATTAALFDPFFSYEWNQMGMPELNFRHYGWVLTAGESVLKLRWDTTKGDVWQFYGENTVPVSPDGQEETDAPYVNEGSGMRLGDFTTDVLCPTSVLFPYGPEPTHRKPWVIQEYYEDVSVLLERYGVEVPPDSSLGTGGVLGDTLLQLQYSSYYPNTQGGAGLWGVGLSQPSVVTANQCRVYERWQRATASEPHGRLTIIAGGKLLYDDINPFVTEERSEVLIPFFRFPKPDLPFRQEGGSDVESLAPIADQRNRVLAGMIDQQAHNEQPLFLFDRNKLVEDEVQERGNLAGARMGTEGNVEGAAKFLSPPPLSPAAKELNNLLLSELNDEGHVGMGTLGQAVTADASGELQREVRFDTDRPWGATLRLHSYEWQRFGEMLVKMAAVCMEDERVLAIAGEDQALQFISVRGELFQGAINVQVQPESMVLETRQDKQNRLIQLLKTAAELRATAPDYADLLLSNLNYPNIQRLTQRGGPGYALAQRHIASLIATNQLPPIWPEQDHATMVRLCTEYMQGQAFGNLPSETQQLLRVFRQMHQMAGVQQGMEQTQQQASAQALAAGIQAQATLPVTTAVAGAEAQMQGFQRRQEQQGAEASEVAA